MLGGARSNGMVEAFVRTPVDRSLITDDVDQSGAPRTRGDSFSATWTLTAAAGLSTRLAKPCEHTVGRDELSSGLRRAPAPLRAVVSAFVGVTPPAWCLP